MTPAPRARLAAAAALAVLAAGCGAEPEGTVIARVGSSSLTLEQATQSLDGAGGSDSDEMIARYAASWVNAELLYQEALRLGVVDDPAFASRMEDVRRRLAGQELLDRLVPDDGADPGDDTLRSYFAAHPDEFTIPEEHRLLRLATFRVRDAARRFASTVTTADGWRSAVDSAAGGGGDRGPLSASGERWYSAGTLYPPELWKVADPLDPGDVSFPVKTGDVYTVVQFLGAAPAGRTGVFELVRDEVLARVLVERSRARLEELLGTLRQRYGVELNVTRPMRQNQTPRSDG